MRQLIAIRHVAFEDLGAFEPFLRQAGWNIHYLDVCVDDLAALDPLRPDLLVVLGGPIGAYEDDIYPFLAQEQTILKARLAAQRPTLGLCLGAQLMARALGAEVKPGPAKEIGWAALDLTETGKASPLRHLDSPVCHWHGDIFDLPEGAVSLARTANTPHQAFALESYALGLQFHAEVGASHLERWFIGHAAEINATPGLSVPLLRDQTAQFGGPMQRKGCAMLAEWLQGNGFN